MLERVNCSTVSQYVIPDGESVKDAVIFTYGSFLERQAVVQGNDGGNSEKDVESEGLRGTVHEQNGSELALNEPGEFQEEAKQCTVKERFSTARFR